MIRWMDASVHKTKKKKVNRIFVVSVSVRPWTWGMNCWDRALRPLRQSRACCDIHRTESRTLDDKISNRTTAPRHLETRGSNPCRIHERMFFFSVPQTNVTWPCDQFSRLKLGVWILDIDRTLRLNTCVTGKHFRETYCTFLHKMWGTLRFLLHFYFWEVWGGIPPPPKKKIFYLRIVFFWLLRWKGANKENGCEWETVCMYVCILRAGYNQSSLSSQLESFVNSRNPRSILPPPPPIFSQVTPIRLCLLTLDYTSAGQNHKISLKVMLSLSTVRRHIGGNWGIALLIHNVGTWLVNSRTSRFTPREGPPVPLERKLGEPHSGSGCSGETKNLSPPLTEHAVSRHTHKRGLIYTHRKSVDFYETHKWSATLPADYLH